MRKLKLICRFYSGFFFADFCVTLSTLGLLLFYGAKAHLILTTLIWYKVITMSVILYLTINSKKHTLYYYQNLGVSRGVLVIATSTIDFILFLALFTTTYTVI